MKVALLIGFQYQDDPEDYLPGILVDLYLAYQAITEMKVDRFLMITDIRSDLALDLLTRALSDSIIDSGILSFIEEAREKKFYCLYHSQSEFIAQISEIVGGGSQIFVYYTGHGDNGDMLLPSGDGPAHKLSMYSFRKSIENHSLPKSQIFFLMDCCSDTQMKLPYRMSDGKYKLTVDTKDVTDVKEHGLTTALKSIKFSKHNIICLSSVGNDGSAHITEKGSFFTQSFFACWKQQRIFRHLIVDIENFRSDLAKEKVTCYTSDPQLGYIWGWLIGKLDVTCKFDYKLQALIVNRNNTNVCLREN